MASVPSTEAIVQVNVGDGRVVGVNNWGEIFSRAISESNTMGDEWNQIHGHLKQVVTSQRHVNWGLDSQGGLWYMHSTDPIPPEPTDVQWLPVHYDAAKMADLDVGRDGIVWGCAVNGAVVVREGIEGTDPEHADTHAVNQARHSGASWSV